jgi:pyruvate dehydrogenase E2 component (dihydrolipoamide acetyltransferase)
MAYEIVVPRLGLTMEEGRIVEWFKEPGEAVEEGEALFAVETDKIVLEIEAAVGGIVYPLPDLPDEPMPIGRLIGYILAPGEERPHAIVSGVAVQSTVLPKEATPPTPVETSLEHKADGRKLSSPAARRRAQELGIDWCTVERDGGGPILLAHVEAAAQSQVRPERLQVSPVAKRLAASAGIDLTEIAAQKPGEKILRADVEAAIAAQEMSWSQSETRISEPVQAPKASSIQASGSYELLPITQIRRIIAERMVEGSQVTAPVTLTTEADATELVSVRERFKAALSPRDMLVPTYTDLLTKLTSIALSEHPMLNASWQEDGIVVQTGIHIAIAVDVESGLVVPVIRDVPSKSLQQIAEESRALAHKARARQLGVDDLQGGTFTLTNLGTYGIDAFTPIINPPQCAILGVGRIIEKPAVVEGKVVPRHMMALSLTFDHRVVDGGPASRFLNMVREYVEQPYQWLSQ